MSRQTRIEAFDAPATIEPVRESPMFWVRRLVFLRELALGDENVVRDIELRRGLNIIWSPYAESGPTTLFANGMASHTAGKTTFCRLLRFALGEDHFAAPATRSRIRLRFPKGWVAAEVLVDGEAWWVARPCAIGAHPFCRRGGTLAELVEATDRLPYEAFRSALATAVVEPVPTSSFPTDDAPIRWEHLLPWLTRDQECRFAGFLEWRHTTSDSGAPALTVDERQFLVRAVLHLISDVEATEQQRNATLVEQRKQADALAPFLARQAQTEHVRVQELLGVELPAPTSELFADLAHQRLEEEAGAVLAAEKALEVADPRVRLREAWQSAVGERGAATKELELARDRLEAAKGALSALAKPGNDVRTEGPRSLMESQPPPRGYCNVPMTDARKEHCPLATSTAVDLGTRRSRRADSADEQRMAEEVARAERQVEAAGAAFQRADDAARDAQRAWMEAATKIEATVSALAERRARLQLIRRLVDDARNAAKASVEQATRIQSLSKEIKSSQRRQADYRSHVDRARGRFSTTYDYVVRALLGDDVDARLETAGRALNPIINYRGERDSAAIETVKLIAFDLAAIFESIQGRGSFPRFLLHDGPRDADMAPDIYERVFLLAHQLEGSFPPEKAGFQYILTTTTSPPEKLAGPPFMRVTLSGHAAEQRLLACDL